MAARPHRRPGRTDPSGSGHPWAVLPREQLLEVPLCDLDVAIGGTWLEECIERLYDELDQRGLWLRPHCWLSDEWFCPHGVPGIAIPFYLAHPRLMRLEHQEMQEVEGGTRRECLRLLRHEAGHAILHAHALHRRKRWQMLFGRSTKPYPEAYRPDPASRRYVQYLGHWYAQSHPLEDFAESFAAWLDPRSAWKRRYRKWPAALEKLEYIDTLMEEFAGLRSTRIDRRRIDEVNSNRTTLGEHYRRRQEHYGKAFPAHFDDELRRLFPDAGPRTTRAATLLRRHRAQLRRRVLVVLPDDGYAIDLVLKELIGRAGELELRALPRAGLVEDCALMVGVQTTRRIHEIREWYAV